jgi:hypothetical protein
MFIPGGIILILQIALAIHVIKTGRPWYWIMLIVFLPLIGIIAYAVVELGPEYLGGARGQRAASAMGRAITPGRNYRRLFDAVEATPTAQNMMALAEECMAMGRYPEAVDLYRRCLGGVHAEDTAILYGLAQAEFKAGDAAAAKATLERLNAIPHYESADAHLLFARSLEALGDLAAARQEYEAVSRYYPGPEALCRYALLLQKAGEPEQAAAIFADVKTNLDRSPRHVRRFNRGWYDLASSGGKA